MPSPETLALYFKSVAGGRIFLGRGLIHAFSQRLQYQCTSTHHAEVGAGNVMVMKLIPEIELANELRIIQSDPCPIYCDSKTTVLISLEAASVRRSAFLLRKMLFMQECSSQLILKFYQIPEKDNIADEMTKYIVLAKWKAHLMYANNMRLED